jgi:hypothetical protein
MHAHLKSWEEMSKGNQGPEELEDIHWLLDDFPDWSEFPAMFDSTG